MTSRSARCALSTCIFLFAAGIFASAHGQGQDAVLPPTAPDSTLYTSYFSESGYQSISWVVCGSTQQTEGCYGSGSLGPFGRAGALIEGSPSTSGDTVTRHIYVVDIESGASGTGVSLYVYKKTDTVSSTYDTTVVTLTNTVSLPLTGGSEAVCSMAANSGYLFIGTNQSPEAVEVKKSNLSVTQVGGFEPPINVTSITADQYGYVTVTFGGINGGDSGFVQFGPNGQGEGDGGGAWFMLNTMLGLSTTSLPTEDYFPADKLVVKTKPARQ